jgi:hypothetical protein
VRPPSRAQLTALRIVQRFGGNGEGWAEIDLQLASELGLPQYLEAAVCWRIFKALERRGLTRNEADGPVLTEQGLVLLASRGAR